MSIFAVEHRWRIQCIPVEYRDRPEGSESKLSTVSDGAKVVGAIVRIFKDCKPFAFFGVFALLFLLVGLVIGIPVIVEWFNTGLVPRLPSALLAVALVFCGVMAFCTGLILDTIAHQRLEVWELGVIREFEHEQHMKRHAN